jgi:hypothetical protein
LEINFDAANPAASVHCDRNVDISRQCKPDARATLRSPPRCAWRGTRPTRARRPNASHETLRRSRCWTRPAGCFGAKCPSHHSDGPQSAGSCATRPRCACACNAVCNGQRANFRDIWWRDATMPCLLCSQSDRGRAAAQYVAKGQQQKCRSVCWQPVSSRQARNFEFELVLSAFVATALQCNLIRLPPR